MRGAAVASPPVEGAAMRIAGRSFGSAEARLIAVPTIAIAGCAVWMLLPRPSDAESPSVPASSAVIRVVQDATESTLAETAAPVKPPVDGLRISAQSWRRGGLGSKALVTFTLRNRNDYAVKDIEIACAFARRDGSHLTDRRRVISDTVNMKSRKRYSGMLVGFVNVNANKAKCSAVAASRI
jgi:hypothetical protein